MLGAETGASTRRRGNFRSHGPKLAYVAAQPRAKRGRGFAQRLRQRREAIQSQIRLGDLEVTP
jgi:hypothetical protein